MSNITYNPSLSNLRERLFDLGRQQDEVAEARAQILVKRDIVLQMFKSIRSQRQILANAEARYMDAIRKQFYPQASTSSESPVLLHSVVEQERSKLSELEDEITPLLQNLDVSEWDLSDQENDLYQFNLQELLPEDNEVPVPSLGRNIPDSPQDERHVRGDESFRRYEDAVVEQRQLLSVLQSLRDEHFFRNSKNQARHSDSTISLISVEDTENLMDRIVQTKVKAQGLKPEISLLYDDFESPIIGQDTVASEPVHASTQKHLPIHSRTRSEGLLQPWKSPSEGLLPVQDWLLDRLRNSDIEKARYMEILQNQKPLTEPAGQAFQHWEQYVTLFWLHDGTNAPTLSRQSPSCDDQFKSDKSSDKNNHWGRDLEGIGDCFEAELPPHVLYQAIPQIEIPVSEAYFSDGIGISIDPMHQNVTETGSSSSGGLQLPFTATTRETGAVSEQASNTVHLAVDTCVNMRYDSAHNSTTSASPQIACDPADHDSLEISQRNAEDQLSTSTNSQIARIEDRGDNLYDHRLSRESENLLWTENQSSIRSDGQIQSLQDLRSNVDNMNDPAALGLNRNHTNENGERSRDMLSAVHSTYASFDPPRPSLGDNSIMFDSSFFVNKDPRQQNGETYEEPSETSQNGTGEPIRYFATEAASEYRRFFPSGAKLEMLWCKSKYGTFPTSLQVVENFVPCS